MNWLYDTSDTCNIVILYLCPLIEHAQQDFTRTFSSNSNSYCMNPSSNAVLGFLFKYSQWNPVSSTEMQTRSDRGDFPAGESGSLLRTITETNQVMSRQVLCNQPGFYGFNQLVHCGDAISTARHKYKSSKWQWKGLNLTCNLIGQRLSMVETARAVEGWRP